MVYLWGERSGPGPARGRRGSEADMPFESIKEGKAMEPSKAEPGHKLGELIRALREERGMSLGDLERASGVGKGYLWELETETKANPSVDILQKIARALEVPASRLIGEPEAAAVPTAGLPRGLKEFMANAERNGSPLTSDEIAMLRQIQYRGRRPRSAEDWALLYDVIRRIVK